MSRAFQPLAVPVRALAMALIVLCSAGCARFASRADVPEMPPVQTFVLSNGLTVYAQENRDVPLVTLDMWVRVGSKDEPAEMAGSSHFLEHMLFKGTPRLGVGEYDRRIEELGGYLNAATSSDYTHYYLTVPSEHLDRALEDMADVLVNSTVDPGEVEKERQVILEEIRQKQDNPVGFMYDEIVRRMYASGPYAGTVIGTPETVTAATADRLREHYRRHYAPKNMAFVAVGDFDGPALRDRLEELLGKFDRPFQPWRDAPPPTEFARESGERFVRDWRQTYFFVTFPGEAVQTLDQAAAMDVAERLLTGGRSARLVNSLREKRHLVTSISSFGPSGRFPGFWAFYGSCDADKTDAVRTAILEEIARLRREGPTEAEMRRVKRQLLTDHLYHAESNTGRASLLGYGYALFGSPALLTDYPAAIERTTAEQAMAVLGRMTADKAALWVAGPPETAESAN